MATPSSPHPEIAAFAARWRAAVQAFERELFPSGVESTPSMPGTEGPRLFFPGVKLGAPQEPRPTVAPPIYVRQESYSIIKGVTAPDPVTTNGNSFDAGDIYDGWIVISTVPVQVSFAGKPDINAPVVSAGTPMNFPVRASVIYYRAPPNTPNGVLNIWLAKY